MNFKNAFELNIVQLYVIKLSKWLMLTMPIVFLFYKENGLGTSELFLLRAIYSVAIVVLEIPSGYIGDVWGRKNAMIIGSILGTLGFGVYCFANGFYGFLIAELILGTGQSFISGCDSALLYDSLLSVKKEGDYLKEEGRLISIGNYAEAIAAPVGVMLAAISLRTPYYFQTLIAFSAIPAALLLKDPHEKLLSLKENKTRIFEVLKYTFLNNKALKWNVIVSSVTGAATLSMAWLVQPLFDHLALPLYLYGVFIPGLNLLAGTISSYAYRFENRFGFKNTLFLITTGIPLMYILIGFFNAVWAIIFLFVFYFIRGIATPALKNHINIVTPSEIRATILSVRNLIIRLTFAMLGPVLGWYADYASLPGAMICAGLFFLFFGLFSSFKLLFFKSE